MKNESFEIKTTSTSFDKTQVVLKGHLIIRNAEAIKQQLLTALTNSQKLELVFENVTKVDLAFLQLLIALKKNCANFEKEVSIVMDSSGYIKSVIKNSGMERGLGTNQED